MSEDTETASDALVTPEGTETSMQVHEAARLLRSMRKTKSEQPVIPAVEPSKEAAPDNRSEAQKAEDAAQPEEVAPGETAEAIDPEEETLPPIEPPRSWTADDKELFHSLPRETQERIADRERSRERDFRRSQDDAAEKLKGLTAKEQAVEQARQQYESALPQLFQTLQQQQAGEFSDVKTIQDVERLAREDWPRYLQWDVSQKKLAAVQQEMLASQQRSAQEKQQKFVEFAKRQDDLFTEKVKDMADPAKMAKLQTSALSTLKGLGFDETELAQSWNGEKDLSLRDHRLQLLIRDATLWREAQAKAAVAAKKPVPPAQRPGAAQAKGAAAQNEIQTLEKRLDNASGLNALRIATQLRQAQRNMAAR